MGIIESTNGRLLPGKAIKEKLLRDTRIAADLVVVYSYLGHVYVISSLREDLRPTVEQIARAEPGTQEVTAHWFPEGVSRSPQSTKASSSYNGLWSFRIESWGTEAILVGYVAHRKEMQELIDFTAKHYGSKQIHNYLKIHSW